VDNATLQIPEACFHEDMNKKKKALKSVRISLQAYESLRRVAFRRHVPMTQIIDELISMNK
jgi:hypothetical protein